MTDRPTSSALDRKPFLPPAYFLGSIVTMVALNFLLPGARVLAFPWTLAGLAPVAIGGALNISSDRAFKKHQTTVKPFEISTSLVTDGVFRLSRNPMYLGMILILLGVALLLGALTPFAVCLVFAVLVHYRFIRIEETMLAETFGRSGNATVDRFDAGFSMRRIECRLCSARASTPRPSELRGAFRRPLLHAEASDAVSDRVPDPLHPKSGIAHANLRPA